MLDSTGNQYNEEVLCFICGESKLKFEVYKPQYGHRGESLGRLPPCMAPHSKKIEGLAGAKLFEIKPWQKGMDVKLLVHLEEYQLLQSRQPYHYDGYHLPNFGESVGSVIYVCAACLSGRSDHLHEKLSKRFAEKFDVKSNDFVYRLFWNGIVTPIPPQKIKERLRRQFDRYERKRFAEELQNLLLNLRGAQQTTSVRKATRLIRPFTKAI